MRLRDVMLSLVCVMLVASAASADLKVGDKAPPLSIAKWLKGEAVDLSKAKANEIFVVEFWATWCGPCRQSAPHLSEIQDYFKDKNVTVIGVSDEKASVVKTFLERGYDGKMRYTVAIDKNNKTTEAWFEAAGLQGIPAAFVVKDGKIEWIGHPMDGLDMKLAEMRDDKAYVARLKKLEKLQAKLQEAAEQRDWNGVVEVIDGIREVKPDDHELAMTKYLILVRELDKDKEAAALGRSLVKQCDEATALDRFAWVLLTDPSLEGERDLPLATAAAEKAMKLTQEKDVSVLDTYARALASKGDFDGAAKHQAKAVRLCEDDRILPELKSTLEEYKKRAQGA